MQNDIKKAAEWIKNSNNNVAFTGAGISVESGVPPFRGESGIWNKYDPQVLDIGFFHSNTEESWKAIKEIFYHYFQDAKPNAAHKALAHFEEKKMLECVITQNIDNLHQEAGSKTVYEFHGNSKYMITLDGEERYPVEEIDLGPPVPLSPTGKMLKPDFIFFGEGIPEFAYTKSHEAANMADVLLVIGTTGEVVPASLIPFDAKRRGTKIIEINTKPSNYTREITDIFLAGRASEIMSALEKEVFG